MPESPSLLTERGRDMTIRTGAKDMSGITRLRYEPTPWRYERTDPRHSRNPYTLVITGSFKQRIYDWEGRPVVVRR